MSGSRKIYVCMYEELTHISASFKNTHVSRADEKWLKEIDFFTVVFRVARLRMWAFCEINRNAFGFDGLVAKIKIFMMLVDVWIIPLFFGIC